MRFLRQPIFILQWILIIFSAIAFILASIEGFKMSFDLSSKSFQNYLKLFNPYSILFAATFVVITAQLAIERLGLMSEANVNSFKASNRTQWIQTVREFFNEIKEDDPYICKMLSRQLLPIHDYLFDKSYKISTADETKDFFNKFFATRVCYFEEMNTKYLNIACYQSREQSYSWINFNYIVFVMVAVDESYKDFLKDLEKLYKEKVLEYSTPHIDPAAYELSAKEYYSRRLRGMDLK